MIKKIDFLNNYTIKKYKKNIMDELRKIQAERYERQRTLERKQKEDEERVIWESKLNDFTQKIKEKRDFEKLMKEQNHPSYYATKIVRFLKPWFKKVPDEFKMFGRRDLFQMPEGDIVSMERLQEIVSVLGYDHYSEYQKKRFMRMLKFIDEDKYIKYWQDRDYERECCRGKGDNKFILEAFLLRKDILSIEFIPMFEKWVEAFPFEDPFVFLQTEKVCFEKEESNVFKIWRMMRLILIVSEPSFYIPWDLGINEDEFKVHLHEELNSALDSILRVNRMLQEEPVELEIKCGNCGKTNEQHWVFCYGRKFRLCRFCATQVSPEHRTEINQSFPEQIIEDNESSEDESSENSEEND